MLPGKPKTTNNNTTDTTNTTDNDTTDIDKNDTNDTDNEPNMSDSCRVMADVVGGE